ncbi:MAG: Fic family protein [Candidatus Neomarinimicrobiota bacterium]
MSDPKYQINPDRSIPWNALPALPIEKQLYYQLEILEQLGAAKAALGRLQGRSAAIPNPGVLINTISLQEAKASSAIENILTTDDDLYKAFSDLNSESASGPAKEVLRYREALWHGHALIQGLPKFDQDYLINIYRQVKQTTDGIRPPFLRTVIKQVDVESGREQIIYTPPRGAGIIEAKLDNLLIFLNADEMAVDPLLKMAIGHFQFEAIHPFRDGNGRTGRIFNIHYLVKTGLLDWPLLFLSRYIIDNKREYYRLLDNVAQAGDWLTWIKYMLKAVEITANNTYHKINDILDARDAILKTVATVPNLRRPEALVNMLFTQPFSKVAHFTGKKIYAENTARNYLNQLCDLGILEKRILGGHHYYLNLELYRILGK